MTMERDERITNFYLEYAQGVEPQYLLMKYGFDGIATTNVNGDIEALNREGSEFIQALKVIDPRDIVRAKHSQTQNKGKYPWTNPFSVLKQTDTTGDSE